jgi:hypothetical protein
MNENSIVSRAPDLFHSYLEKDAVMMNVKTGHYFRLNEVGTRIWDLLEGGPLGVGILADRILPEFSVAREQLVADIIAFVAKGREQGILDIRE